MLNVRCSYCPYCTNLCIVASHAPLSSYPTRTSGGTRARERDPRDPCLAHRPSMPVPSSTLAPTSLRRTSYLTHRNTTHTVLPPPYTFDLTALHFLAFILLAITYLTMTTQTSAQPAATWDEDQNIAALAHLERMQEQVSQSPDPYSKYLCVANAACSWMSCA
jgi:hypothetical protein